MNDRDDDRGLQWWAEVGQQAMDTCLTQTYRTPLGTAMPDLNEMIPSKYLKQTDIDQDYIVTVKSIDKMNMAKPGEPVEWKWTATFREFDKPMVMNTTNLNSLSQACLSTKSEDWIGKEVILYVDPSISFGGKVTGGLRIKANRPEPTKPRRAAAQANPQSLQDMDSDIPF